MFEQLHHLGKLQQGSLRPPVGEERFIGTIEGTNVILDLTLPPGLTINISENKIGKFITVYKFGIYAFGNVIPLTDTPDFYRLQNQGLSLWPIAERQTRSFSIKTESGRVSVVTAREQDRFIINGEEKEILSVGKKVNSREISDPNRIYTPPNGFSISQVVVRFGEIDPKKQSISDIPVTFNISTLPIGA